MDDRDWSAPADDLIPPPPEVAAPPPGEPPPPYPGAPQPPRRPRHWTVVTVILSVLVIAGIVGTVAVYVAQDTDIAGPNGAVRDADLSLPAAQGASGTQVRAKLAEQMRRLLRHEDTLPPNVATAARVLLVIVLVDDGKADDARATAAALSPPALGGLLRCAFPALGACEEASPELAVLDDALAAIGGGRSEAAGRIRDGLARNGSAAAQPVKPALAESPRAWRRLIVPAFLIVAAVITAVVLRRVRRGKAAAPRPPAPPAPWSVWGFWSALVRWIAASTVVLIVGAIPVVIAVFRHQAPPTTFPVWGLALYEACCVLLVVPMFLRPWGLTFKEAFGFSRGVLDAWSVVANTLATVALVLVGTQVLGWLMQLLGVPGVGLVESQGLSATEGVVAWLITIAYTVVGAPVLEEILFRGLLFGVLRPRLGQVLGACISAAVFAAVHPYGWSGRIVVAFYALAFSWRYVRSGSLLPGMLAHALVNVVAILDVAL